MHSRQGDVQEGSQTCQFDVQEGSQTSRFDIHEGSQRAHGDVHQEGSQSCSAEELVIDVEEAHIEESHIEEIDVEEAHVEEAIEGLSGDDSREEEYLPKKLRMAKKYKKYQCSTL